MQINTLREINRAFQHKHPAALITDLHSGEQSLYLSDSTQIHAQAEQAAISLRNDRSLLIENDSELVFIRPHSQPLKMIIVGAVHIAQALLSMARQCGYDLTLVDPRESFTAADRFPDTSILNTWPDAALQELEPDARTAIITLSHDPKIDDPALEIALGSEAFYIGSLGSRRTHAARQQRLSEKGFTEEQQARIQAPIGLDIGAQSPAEIAIAIMAEVTQAHRKRT